MEKKNANKNCLGAIKEVINTYTYIYYNVNALLYFLSVNLFRGYGPACAENSMLRNEICIFSKKFPKMDMQRATTFFSIARGLSLASLNDSMAPFSIIYLFNLPFRSPKMIFRNWACEYGLGIRIWVVYPTIRQRRVQTGYRVAVWAIPWLP